MTTGDIDKQINVLLVEDDPESGEATRMILEKRGVEVALVAKAEEVMDRLQSGSFDIVVADIRLQGMSGVEVLRQIRKEQPDFPVILITGYDDLHSAIEAVRLDAQDYILKPFGSIDDLLAPVKRAVRTHRLLLRNRELEQGLAASEARLKSILSSMYDFVFVLDAETRFVFFNMPSSTKSLWKSPDEFIGRKHADVMPPALHAMFREAFERTRKGETVEYDYCLDLPRGKSYFSAKLSPMFQKGIFAGVVAVVRDITERTRAGQELLANQKRLSDMAKELLLTEERERQRLAVELHDSVTQMLAISSVELDSVHRSAEDSALEKIEENVRGALQRIRSVTFSLTPPVLYQVGLEAALEELAGETEKLYGFHTTFEDDGQGKPLDKEIAGLLFRAVREILVNAAKHGKAKNARVSIGQRDQDVMITVVNDGAGFDPEKKLSSAKTSGFGLFSIRERLKTIGGHMEIESSPETPGTEVRIFVPFKH